MWSYGIEKQSWEALKLNGNVPSPRSSASTCVVGDRIYLFGGEGDAVIYRDFFIFNILTNYWTQISDLDLPPARYGACMACFFPYFFIYGGVTVNGYDGSFYVINLRDMTVTEMPGYDSFIQIQKRAFSNCWAYKTKNGDIEYLLTSGETDGKNPAENAYVFTLSSKNWTLVGYAWAYSKAVAAFAGNKILFVSGEVWGERPVIDIIEFDVVTQDLYLLGELENPVMDAAGTYVKTDLYVHNGIAAIEKKIFYGKPSSHFHVLRLNKDCTELGCYYPCSPGTYADGEGCTFCPKGTYNDVSGASSCKKCPAGTFSNRIGNTLDSQCYHCPEGQFNPTEGSRLCLDCPNGSRCSIGSVEPDTKISKEEGVKSSQPASYSGKDFNFSYFIYVFQYSMIALAVPILLVFCLISREKRIGFKKLDIYNELHTHFIGEQMIKQETVLGGLASVLFFLVALLFFITALVVFIYDNVVETKALVPLVTLQEDFNSVKPRQFTTDLNVTLALMNYGDQCGDSVGNCDSNVYIGYSNIDGTLDTTCIQRDKTCRVEITCKSCELNYGAMLNYEFQQPYAFSESIAVNVTTTSSIPGEVSSIQQTISSDSDQLFRGFKPSEFFFQMTPSVSSRQVFITDSSEWTSDVTGYHVSMLVTPVKGSTSTVFE